MRVKGSLHLGWIDVDPAGDDHVDPAVADVVVPVGISIGDVAHREEAAVQALVRGVRSPVVLAQPGVSHHDLSGLPVGALVAFTPDKPYLLTRHRSAA